MSCNCIRCVPENLGTYRATTSVDGNKLVITLCNVCSKYLVQGDRISFYIPHCITYPTTAIKNAVVSINGTEFDLIKNGDVKWDQIRSRTCYACVIGTEEPTLTVLNDLCKSAFAYPTYQTNCSTFEKVEA